MPKIVDKQQKAAEIAAAAIGVFCERGYHGTRMIDLARGAGVGKGTLYEYFGGKADILQAAFEHYFASFEQGALEALGTAQGPAGKLVAVVRFALEHAADWEAHCRVYVDYFSVARTGEQAGGWLSGLYARFGELLTALLAEGQAAGEIRADADPRSSADLLVSVYDGLVLRSIFDARAGGAGERAAAALRLIEHGLLTEVGRTRTGGRTCSATSS